MTLTLVPPLPSVRVVRTTNGMYRKCEVTLGLVVHETKQFVTYTDFTGQTVKRRKGADIWTESVSEWSHKDPRTVRDHQDEEVIG